MKRRGFLGALVGLGAAACGRAGASEAVASVPSTLPTGSRYQFIPGAAGNYIDTPNPLAKGLERHFGAAYAHGDIAWRISVQGDAVKTEYIPPNVWRRDYA